MNLHSYLLSIPLWLLGAAAVRRDAGIPPGLHRRTDERLHNCRSSVVRSWPCIDAHAAPMLLAAGMTPLCHTSRIAGTSGRGAPLTRGGIGWRGSAARAGRGRQSQAWRSTFRKTWAG